MTEREKEIVRFALIYLQANREDAIEAFEVDYPAWVTGWDDSKVKRISVNGELMETPKEQELESLLMVMQ